VLALFLLSAISFAQNYQYLPDGGYIIRYNPPKEGIIYVDGEAIKVLINAEIYNKCHQLVSQIIGPYF
jgi:hypothetical protein